MNNTDNLVLLLRRTSRRLPPFDPLRVQAVDYLKRIGQAGNELRGVTAERAERAEEIADRYGKRAISLEAELAAERARLDWLGDHGWVTGEPCDRAAIDAAMKADRT
jgi:hypothetical protein